MNFNSYLNPTIAMKGHFDREDTKARKDLEKAKNLDCLKEINALKGQRPLRLNLQESRFNKLPDDGARRRKKINRVKMTEVNGCMICGRYFSLEKLKDITPRVRLHKMGICVNCSKILNVRPDEEMIEDLIVISRVKCAKRENMLATGISVIKNKGIDPIIVKNLRSEMNNPLNNRMVKVEEQVQNIEEDTKINSLRIRTLERKEKELEKRIRELEELAKEFGTEKRKYEEEKVISEFDVQSELYENKYIFNYINPLNKNEIEINDQTKNIIVEKEREDIKEKYRVLTIIKIGDNIWFDEKIEEENDENIKIIITNDYIKLPLNKLYFIRINWLDININCLNNIKTLLGSPRDLTGHEEIKKWWLDLIKIYDYIGLKEYKRMIESTDSYVFKIDKNRRDDNYVKINYEFMDSYKKEDFSTKRHEFIYIMIKRGNGVYFYRNSGLDLLGRKLFLYPLNKSNSCTLIHYKVWNNTFYKWIENMPIFDSNYWSIKWNNENKIPRILRKSPGDERIEQVFFTKDKVKYINAVDYNLEGPGVMLKGFCHEVVYDIN